MQGSTKKFSKVSYALFDDAAKQLGISEPDLAEKIGYHRNAHNHWKVSGLIPKVASIAAECMLRRKNVNCKDHSTLVVKVDNSKLESVKSVLNALDCSLVEV
jgi:hypothetical protein